MENNLIPLISYEKLIKKLRIIKFFLFFTTIICCILIFFIINNLSEKSFWPFFIVLFLILLVGVVFLLLGEFNTAIVRELAKFYNWPQEKTNNDILRVAIKDFKERNEAPEHVVEDLKKFNVYSINPSMTTEFLLKGHFCNRNFCLYQVDIVELSRSYTRYLLMKTDPIFNFNKTILIRPRQIFSLGLGNFIKQKTLKEAQVNTHNLFRIYTDNLQDIDKDISAKFLEQLCLYGKNVCKDVLILITPKHILITKIFRVVDISSFFLPVKKCILKQRQKAEDFLKLLDAINLLEKK